MHGDAHPHLFRSWTAIAAGVVLGGLGLAGFLYNFVLLTTHLWCLWVLSAMASQVTGALLGQVSPLMLALNLSGGGWMLAAYGLQILPPPAEDAHHGCGATAPKVLAAPVGRCDRISLAGEGRALPHAGSARLRVAAIGRPTK